MRFILPLILLLPLLEIAGFVIVGGEIGVLPTLALIILTALGGIWLLRRQGVDTIRRAQDRLNRGEPPVREAFDGLCLALAGVLLIIPGFITDAAGLLLFLPPVRASLLGRATVSVRPGGMGTEWRGAGQPRYRDTTVIDVDYTEVGPAADHRPTATDELPPPDSRWRPPQR